jgi:hypothetical protein
MSRLLRYYLFALLWLAGAQRPLTAQVVEWAKLARNLSSRTVLNENEGAVDRFGNSFASFTYLDSVQVGTRVYRRTTQSATLLLKYNSRGAVQWTHSLHNAFVEDLAADANGGVYLLLYTLAGATWNGTPIGANRQYLYARCAANGSLRWAHALPAGANLPALNADGLGKWYLIDTPTGAMTLGGVPLTSAAAYLCQGDSAGTIRWVQQIHGDGSAWSLGLGPAGVGLSRPGGKLSGGCLIFGVFRTRMYFGAGTNVPYLDPSQPSPNSSTYLASFDDAGNLLWSQTLNPATSGVVAQPHDLVGDAAGNCYISGRSAVSVNGYTTTDAPFLAKFSATGAPLWAKGCQPVPIFGFSNGFGYALAINPVTQGVSMVVYNDLPGMQPLVFGPLVSASPYGILHYSPQGEEQWLFDEQWRGYLGTTPNTTTSIYRPVAIGYDSQGGLYSVAHNFGNVSPRPTITLGAQTVVGDGAIVAKLAGQINTLLGAVYLDQNGNGQQDGGEGAFPRPLTAQLVQGTDTAYYSSAPDGTLQLPAAVGGYDLSLAGMSPSYTISQPGSGRYTSSFAGAGQLASGKTFGVAPLANRPDVRVTLTPYGNVRPGFLAKYRLTVENVGTTSVSGTATATLDARTQYVGSSPAGTLSGGTLSWSYANLAPFGRQTFDVQFSLPINVPVGTVLSSAAAAPLPGDVNPADNATTTPQTVTGPLDPNDINVNYSQLTPQQVAARLPLDYTVRFQNIGTDTAFTVVVQDTLDRSRLQLGSLQLVAQSHNCTWMLSGRGVLTIRFINAKLPPRSTNVITSQGFVRFRVLPLATLTPGAIIPNHAHITFDYNEPLRTNGVLTTVLLPTPTRAGQLPMAWSAYPNPATEQLTVTAELPAGTPVTVELFDALGRRVRQHSQVVPPGGLRHLLSVGALPAGLYRLQLRTPAGLLGSRGVVRQ